jgi:hypothetical protein
MLTNLDHVLNWLNTAKPGETLVFCQCGDPDIISRRNPHFGEVYAALLEARRKRLVLLDRDSRGQAYAQKLAPMIDANDLNLCEKKPPPTPKTQWTEEDAKLNSKKMLAEMGGSHTEEELIDDADA